MTAERIWDHYRNTREYFETQLYPDDGANIWTEPMQWLKDQEAWVREQVLLHSPLARWGQPQERRRLQQEPEQLGLWGAVELVMAQFDGLMEGYAARVDREEALAAAAAAGSGANGRGKAALGRMSREDHMFLQNNGELYDIIDGWLAGAWGNASDYHAAGAAPAGSSSRFKRSSMRTHDIKSSARQQQQQQRASDAAAWRDRWLRSRGDPGQWLNDVALGSRERCTALIKVTADLSDLFMGHATWDSFTQMTRIYKHYEFGTPGFGRLSFSSYPGETFSDDDFYLSSSGLVVLETTNHVFAPAIYAALTPASLLSWQRVRGALLVAGDGEAWVKAFNTRNSGTYNNQYMVVDLARFKPKHELSPGLLWVVEQLPGMVVAADLTEVLARGYFASYNVPYFPSIYAAAGYPAVSAALAAEAAREGDAGARHRYDMPVRWLKYQVSPRAMIFRRDQADVEDLAAMKDLMRYNNWAKDPFSDDHPLASVCGRADVAPLAKDRLPKGCYDGKVTSYKLALQLRAEVVGGPTTSHGLPPFSWAAWEGQGYAHYGMPTTFNYTWERMVAEDLVL